MANSLHSSDGNHALLQEGVVEKPEPAVAEAQEIPKKHEGGQVQCELKIQVIDDTALIEHSAAANTTKEVVKVEKKPKRRVRKSRKKKDALERAAGEKKGKESTSPAAMYSRKEMEALRFECLEDQKRKWIEVYCALGPSVAEEYDALVDSANNHHKNCVANLNFDPRPPIQNSANLFAVAAMVKANPLVISAH
ncbi:uncharacterized protein LOC127242581 [Andrographis paniculata]|uniref:uncharacterized protein LOC127242581 n=1 Tax=Andrographis paniculata TaxID=175694 RepID=UPI0021E84F10|nr:uncharacterized protein LOC127242581 [Andrographis paniculata]